MGVLFRYNLALYGFKKDLKIRLKNQSLHFCYSKRMQQETINNLDLKLKTQIIVLLINNL